MWQRDARFCPMCGHGLEERQIEGRARKICGKCRFVLYANPAAAAATLVLDEDRVVLIRRDIEPYRGSWTLPAGYEEVDEAPAQTAERETREETGLEVEAYGLYDLLLTTDDPRKPGILAVFLCRATGGELSAGAEEADVRWFPLDELPEPIGFVNNRRILDRLVQECHGDGPRFIPVTGSAGPAVPA